MKKILITTFSILLLSVNFVFAQDVDEDTNDDIQEYVDQRLDDVKNRLIAIIGTVTDKTEDTIQLETESNEIRLVSVVDNATFAQSNGTSGSIEYDDIGIGDYVITMGRLDANNVLVAQRVVVTAQPDEPTQEVVLANITQTEDEFVAISISDGNPVVFEINRSTEITKKDEDGLISSSTSSELDVNDKILIIGNKNEESFEAVRIHIIEQAPEEE